MVNKLRTLTPDEVAAVMTFDAADAQWCYQPGADSMAARQAEGVAGLWNLLAKRRLALLADEVGMGKTYQAMGVMLLLWQLKPNARILVMAPNQTLCHNWRKEFATFTQHHYRANANPFFTGEALAEHYVPQIHHRLDDLVAAVGEKRHRFYLTTIHALSGLVPTAEKDQDAERAAGEYGAASRQQMTEALGNGGFDLLIVDEAHYFRNRSGTQRAAAAAALFGTEGQRLSRRVLLLTATPNHSASRNLHDILSYFTDLPAKYARDDPAALMRDFAIRRLRKMQGKQGSHSKYAYRHERATAASFANRLDAELFFALYQKQLVMQLDDEKKSGSDKKLMYGYLEGFESTGSTASAMEDGGDDQEGPAEDFHQARDSTLLNQLTRQFHDLYNRFPDHPKYDALIAACVRQDPFADGQALHDSKHLIFVRRIPSVREITQRINARYDQMMAERIMDAWQFSAADRVAWRRSTWSRNTFVKLLADKTRPDPEQDADLQQDPADDESAAENEAKLSSRIAGLFVVKKSGLRSTDCSRVSQRFRRPDSLFSLFLEPASDGKTGGYDHYYRKSGSNWPRDSYADAARDRRLGSLSCERQQGYAQTLPCAWGLMFRLLPPAASQQLVAWREGADGVRVIENFANYLRTGYLFASPVMIELYCWFTEFSREPQHSDVQQRYRHFIAWVEPKLRGSLMLRYFAAAIETFETLCVKIVGEPLKNDQYSWREFTSLNSPCWYASGESHNRERLIHGFNSPFYPNVLVATSVLQEGVNLHLQCHQIHHYGIAWTPGDNEQRNGRIDRLFGCINRQLLEQEGAEMTINYPYLEGTFDQDQLASFLQYKHQVEEMLDRCESRTFNRAIDLQLDSQDWQQWLRQPDGDHDEEDPYPATFPPS